MKIYRAGLIPAYVDENGQIHMMFMRPSDTTYGGSDYQIAKGRIEDEETPYDTAIREAEEELGLRMENVEDVFDCGRWLGRTYFYVAIVRNTTDFNPFHFETESVAWMTPEVFYREGRDIHRDVVKHAAQMVEMLVVDQ